MTLRVASAFGRKILLAATNLSRFRVQRRTRETSAASVGRPSILLDHARHHAGRFHRAMRRDPRSTPTRSTRSRAEDADTHRRMRPCPRRCRRTVDDDGPIPAGMAFIRTRAYSSNALRSSPEQLQGAGYPHSRVRVRVCSYQAPLLVSRADSTSTTTACPPDEMRRNARETTDAAIQELLTSSTKPRFLWVHYYDPHAPYDPPEPTAPGTHAIRISVRSTSWTTR